MKIVVVGGSGRIGSNVVRRLAAQGHEALQLLEDRVRRLEVACEPVKPGGGEASATTTQARRVWPWPTGISRLGSQRSNWQISPGR
jgi:NAD(P)-dependent dehydrogenase (short-subunit alcohol dehydrogenase family)